MTFQRRILFDAIRQLRGGQGFMPDEVIMLDDAIDRALGLGGRRINAEGLALIKQFEGLRLQAYRCPADVPTIGYGSTGSHVRMGMTITEAEAERLLMEDLERFEKAVADAAPSSTDNQFSAMISLAFNIGIGAFQKSTVLRKHKAGDHKGAADAFSMWVKAGGRTLPGLVRRRAAESALYRKADA